MRNARTHAELNLPLSMLSMGPRGAAEAFGKDDGRGVSTFAIPHTTMPARVARLALSFFSANSVLPG